LGNRVYRDFADHMLYDITSGKLTIYEVTLNDSGVYWCGVGYNDLYKIHLVVLGKCLYQN